jgi:hypothetical protein
VRNEVYGYYIIWIKYIEPDSDIQKVQIPIFGSPEGDVILGY